MSAHLYIYTYYIFIHINILPRIRHLPYIYTPKTFSTSSTCVCTFRHKLKRAQLYFVCLTIVTSLVVFRLIHKAFYIYTFEIFLYVRQQTPISYTGCPVEDF